MNRELFINLAFATALEAVNLVTPTPVLADNSDCGPDAVEVGVGHTIHVRGNTAMAGYFDVDGHDITPDRDDDQQDLPIDQLALQVRDRDEPFDVTAEIIPGCVEDGLRSQEVEQKANTLADKVSINWQTTSQVRVRRARLRGQNLTVKTIRVEPAYGFTHRQTGN